jgi:hypothetical protein
MLNFWANIFAIQHYMNRTPDYMAASPPNEYPMNTHHSPLDPDSVFGLLGWQINAGKFSCRSSFKKSRQMLWCLYS